MTDYLRRTVIATIGAISVGAGTASAGDYEEEQTQCGQSVDRCNSCTDTCEKDEKSFIVGRNHSTCQRLIFISTTEESFSLQLSPHETSQQIYFAGSIERVECEPGDVDIEIFQRTEGDAHHCE